MSREMIDVMKKLREMGYYDEPKKEKVDEKTSNTNTKRRKNKYQTNIWISISLQMLNR